MKWTERVKRGVRSWAAGRYGNDALNRTVYLIGLVLVLVGAFTSRESLRFIGLGLLIYYMYRALSRDISKRYGENQKFLKSVAPAKSGFYKVRARFRDRKTHKHLTCPSCKKTVRVPKNKGRIRVRCPHCRQSFEARS